MATVRSASALAKSEQASLWSFTRKLIVLGSRPRSLSRRFVRACIRNEHVSMGRPQGRGTVMRILAFAACRESIA